MSVISLEEGSVAGKVLREIEESTKQRFLPIIGPVKGKFLADTVLKYGVKQVMEVGTLIGYSSILIAGNLPPGGKVLTMEINPDSVKLAKQNITRANFSGRIDVLSGDALQLIPGIRGEFDMFFLDAAKDEYLDYLRLGEDRLKKGGVVFADNVKIFADRLQDYLRYVRDSGKYRSEYIDAGFDGVEISVKLF